MKCLARRQSVFPCLLVGLAMLLATLLAPGCGQEPPLPPTSEGAGVASPPPLTIREDALGLAWVLVPGGRFRMRGTEPDVERWVTLSPFWCTRQAVSKGHFEQYLAAQGLPFPEGPYPEGLGAAGDLPYQNPMQWNTFRGGLSMATRDHRMTYLQWAEAAGLAEWVSQATDRTVSVISEAQFDWIRRSGAITGEEIFWWQGPQPSGLGAWLWDLDRHHSYPEAYPGLPTLYTQTPWRIYLPLGNFWVADVFGHPLPGGAFTDPVPTTASDAHAHGPLRTTIHYYQFLKPWPVRESRVDRQWGAGVFLVSPVHPDDASAVAPVAPPRPEPPVEPMVPLPARDLDLGGGVTLRLLQVPAGTFTMGRSRESRPWTDEWPQTEVTLESYWLGATEVTQAQFRAVTGINPSLVQGDDLPVHSVTFPEMLAFCDLLTRRERAAGRLGEHEEYRCPTEAEWERAARADRPTLYAHGDEVADLPFYAWVDTATGPFPVAGKRPNRWGFYDMAGNVLEVLSTAKYPYRGGQHTGHWFTGAGGRIGWMGARGGAWNMGAPAAVPTIRRSVPVGRTYHIGFRVACGPAWPHFRLGRDLILFPRQSYEEFPDYCAIMTAQDPTWIPTATKP